MSRVELRVLIPAVENSSAATPIGPGDVLATRKGLTVEVGNTDAEGRLVLCRRAGQRGCRHTDLMIDFATLTGAARIALGPELPALFGDDEQLVAAVARAAQAEHDPLWPMPLWLGYDDELGSKIADLNNVSASTSFAGAIFGALFLQPLRDRIAALAAHRSVCMESKGSARTPRRRRGAGGPRPVSLSWHSATVLRHSHNDHGKKNKHAPQEIHRCRQTRGQPIRAAFRAWWWMASSRRPAARCCAPSDFSDADFGKPQIGIASTWSNLTPCNMHIDELAREAAAGVEAHGGKAVTFNTITVSDGISMGTPGMRYSLVSREVIADSIETVVGAAGLRRRGGDRRLRQEHAGVPDGDGAARTVRRCSSTAAPSGREPERRDIVSVFEAVGGTRAGHDHPSSSC